MHLCVNEQWIDVISAARIDDVRVDRHIAGRKSFHARSSAHSEAVASVRWLRPGKAIGDTHSCLRLVAGLRLYRFLDQFFVIRCFGRYRRGHR